MSRGIILAEDDPAIAPLPPQRGPAAPLPVEHPVLHRTIAASYDIPLLLPSITIDLYGKSFRQVESEAHDIHRTGRTPTGLALWPAGRLLSDFVACCEGSPSTVVDLGCGLGLCGLVSQALMTTTTSGGGLVVLTDYDDETLEYARFNIAHNPSSSSSHNNSNAPASSSSIQCATLDWCNSADIERVKRMAGLDGFDRVLASDVIYEMTAPLLPDLFFTAKSLMKASGGLFFLGIRRRTTSLESVKQVAKHAGLEGGKFVSNFLLDLFDNRLEVSDDVSEGDEENEEGAEDMGDDGSRSLFWAAAVLVYWHADDEVGREMATQLCITATENGNQLAE
jgi:predicted nicotinamide N-methyase